MSHQRSDFLCVRESHRKLQHTAQVFGFKPTAKLLRQLIPHSVKQLVTILGAVGTVQHLSAQAFANTPIQASEFSIHRTGQPLADAGNQRAQFGVQCVEY